MSKENVIDLKYSAKDFCFFKFLNDVNFEIQQVKKKLKQSSIDGVYNIGEFENGEIARGASYAFFPELKLSVENGQAITINDFRDSLKKEGINDEGLQNKVIFIMTQNRGGIQFRLAKLFEYIQNQYYEINQFDFNAISGGNETKITLLKEGHVSFVYRQNFACNDDSNERINVFAFEYNLEISSEKTVLKECKIIKLSDFDEANEFHDFIYENQQNIIMKIINYIKELLGFRKELILESTMEDDLLWSDSDSKSKKRSSPKA